MHGDRLTRQELSWLLTQEARSAAEKLRKGVAILSTPTIPPEAAAQTHVEPALDALDDAMKMLATLHKGAGSRGRRGRIDIAALLWEVAPNARVQMEPGSGTEVFGDEAELRRMLQVLVSATSPTGVATEDATSEVSIRRDGADVRISVSLGPDSSATAETERAWLSRMAIRYGGRLELEGATESVVLPADGASDKREVEELRRELEAAQRQGEAYARELAAVFSQGAETADLTASMSSRPPPMDSMGVLTAVASALASQLRGMFAAIGRDLAPLRDRGGDAEAAVESAAARITAGSELVGDLARIGACATGDLPMELDLVEVVRAAVQSSEARAARHGVSLALTSPDALPVRAAQGPLSALVVALIDCAIAATPKGGSVSVALGSDGRRATIAVEDGGPSIPVGARRALLGLEIDPTTLGRPPGLELFWAMSLATHVGAKLELDDAPGGRTRAKLTLY